MRFSFSFLLFLSSIGLSAQTFPALKEQWLYPHPGDDIPQVIQQASDGNLLLGGSTSIFEAEKAISDVYIAKVSPQGEQIWKADLALDGHQELYDLSATADGGVMAVGMTNNLIEHRELGSEAYWGDYLLIRLDSLGKLVWMHTLGGSDFDFGRAVVAHADGTFTLGGGSFSDDELVGDNKGMNDAWLAWVDEEGSMQSSIVLGGEGNDWVQAMHLSQNKDLLVASFSNSLFDGKRLPLQSSLLIRLSEDYERKWILAFERKQIYAITESPQGKIIVAGTDIEGNLKSSFWWAEVSAEGELLDQAWKRPPFQATFKDVLITHDGGKLLCGYSLGGGDALSQGGEDFWLVRTDSTNKILWQKTYGGPNQERGKALMAFAPNQYYALGEKYNNFDPIKPASMDFWLLKLEDLPCDSLQSEIVLFSEKMKEPKGVPINFQSNSKYAERYHWEFGDGTISDEKHPKKSYQQAGTYEIKLTVYAGEACEHSSYLRKLQIK